jgi:hypothetical protein
MEYNEDEALNQYVFKNYNLMATGRSSGLISGLEQRILFCVGHGRSEFLPNRDAKLKADRTWGPAKDEDIDELLCDGFAVFKKRLRERLLQEKPDIFINRCRKCNKVVATPRARLCLWCNHSWYDEPK